MTEPIKLQVRDIRKAEWSEIKSKKVSKTLRTIERDFGGAVLVHDGKEFGVIYVLNGVKTVSFCDERGGLSVEIMA